MLAATVADLPKDQSAIDLEIAASGSASCCLYLSILFTMWSSLPCLSLVSPWYVHHLQYYCRCVSSFTIIVLQNAHLYLIVHSPAHDVSAQWLVRNLETCKLDACIHRYVLHCMVRMARLCYCTDLYCNGLNHDGFRSMWADMEEQPGYCLTSFKGAQTTTDDCGHTVIIKEILLSYTKHCKTGLVVEQ